MALLRAPGNTQSLLPPTWVGGVLALGVTLSLILFVAVRGWEQRARETVASEIVREQVAKLQVRVLRSMEVLYSVASLHQTQGHIEREQFARFVQQALDRQPELQALSWNPLVPAARRAELEKAAADEGLVGFNFREEAMLGQLVPAGQRPNYVPVYFIEPFDRNAAAVGFDLNSDPVRRSSIEQARDTGKAVATAPIRLAQEASNEAGFLVLLPIYRGVVPSNIVERRERLDGFAVAVFRVADLVGAEFRELKAKGIEAQLFDESTAGEKLFSAGFSKVVKPNTQPASPALLEIASRRWVVVSAPAEEFVAAHASWQSWEILGGGLAFTILTTAYLYSGWRRSRQVAAANIALQQEVIVRQRAEALAAAANQAKSDFLASMSHEIRTPLNAILGYAQLLQRDPALSGEQRDAIRGISTSGDHLLGLINEVLDLAKIEAGRMELNAADFDLGALGRNLATTFKPLCAQKRIAFRVEMDGHAAPRVRGDEGKLRQVLINLLGNAVKFTTAGEVCLRFKMEPENRWLFEVIDTGLGIPEAERAEIFKAFHQGSGAQHQGGTGLGLAIAQRQVELLGGKLELQSERGIGSRFYFVIPLVVAERAMEETDRQVVRLAASVKVCALVIDDRKENRAVLGGMLSAIGCEVHFSASGDEGLSVAREQQLQIVFVDLLLPGLSGAETARRMRDGTEYGQPKVVAHTASPLASHRSEAFAAGCVDFIAKPFRCERIYDCLRHVSGVAFDYSAPISEADPLPSADLGKMDLPEELCARLMVAAELHSTTALKSGLQELRRLGPQAWQLAEQIRHLMRSYDMDGVQRLLSRVAVPHAGPSPNAPHHGTFDEQHLSP